MTLANAADESASLPISAAYSQAEIQALRDKCGKLADDVPALSGLAHAQRRALVAVGIVKGGA